VNLLVLTAKQRRVRESRDTIERRQWPMANTEIQYLKKRINQLENDMRNMVMALIELKVFKVKIDEDGKAVYDTGKDGQ
jgi:hypothetical protein